ncbi:hypothetical protein Kpol_520p13 [Vanderwaltozyma polyspora DSM 70294]|uniref:Altered inheritance of mitochondria protein 24, mitochondrial n=1 Tax=Vanderwaltozyma polyspora (strain ATCC 22028 / DSM 70294 / BCRC 21397 / CBS 2163 / NBRC 10782 / NRRL Y-8283 / UCD 57-17) TaxID=436907 RepID=AIM24_VANPO|nr:uncharacterized protein Kpol_520p13 [Vanderwaltozyma polyspora DSM 70294]A7TM98.1 RecName: Full=Altered inheritance of mitochondria protein 24, mitochondrial; Flags: Precursor [Vanderwaltozyma polyspora DSM 70294]EDO16592.1 hypothetical protein Kpol_520p13 [Vanderwaltozyma polyspora DSM 70294]
MNNNKLLFAPFANKRFITLIPNSKVVKPAIDDSTGTENLFNVEDLKTTTFNAIGEPSTMASLSVPPRIPLYIRRGCIVSLYNNKSSKDSNISMTHEWKSIIFNLFSYSSITSSLFIKLTSDKSFGLLVAPNFTSNIIPLLSKNSYSTLCTLNLNGSADWNIWGKNSIVAYEGNTSLNIVSNPLFNWRSVFKKRPIYSRKFQTIAGRGNVLLSGSGSIYTIELKTKEDEIVIKSECLLGISGSTQLEIKDSISEQKYISNDIIDQKPQPVLKDVKLSDLNKLTKEEYKIYFKDLYHLTSWWIKKTYIKWISGSTKFLKVKGPRNVLIQTGHNVYLPNIPTKKQETNLSVPEESLLTERDAQVKSEMKYTNYVTISRSGDVKFQSTPNFNETINKLKKN